jgi:hypothetical protein
MVDMYMAIEQAVSMTYMATRLDRPAPERIRAVCREGAHRQVTRFVGQGAIKLHGGMGMTNELAVSHYFKRATMIESQLGSPTITRRGWSTVTPRPDVRDDARASSAPAWFEGHLATRPTAVSSRSRRRDRGAELGRARQPGVLLMHGLRPTPTGGASSRRTWPGRRVVAFSGHGALRLARDLLAGPVRAKRRSSWLKRAACSSAQPPILVGHSFGSFVARTVARRGRASWGGAGGWRLAAREDDDEYDGAPSAASPPPPWSRRWHDFVSRRRSLRRYIADYIALQSVRGNGTARKAGRGGSIPTCAQKWMLCRPRSCCSRCVRMALIFGGDHCC